MARWTISIAVLVALLAGLGRAQEPPSEGEKPSKETGEDSAETKTAGRVVDLETKTDEVRVVKPEDVASELKRLEKVKLNKADIKAEVVVHTGGGRTHPFKGVIRNGKLIERIVDGRYVSQEQLDSPRCGVRLWWSGDSDGFIFFRYSSIKLLKLAGELTDEERREIRRRLERKRRGEDPNKEATPRPEENLEPELDKMTPAELKSHLLEKYPESEGWDHGKKRELSRAQILEGKVLSRDEAIFLKYFPVLVQARFEDLKRSKGKIEIEPDGGEPEDRDDER